MPFDIQEPVTIADDAGSGLALVATPSPGDDFVQLLEQVEFGSTGLRYRRLGLGEQLARLPDAVFLELRSGAEIVGSYAVASMPLRLGGLDVAGFYRGLLAVRASEARRGYGRFLVTETRDWLDREIRKRDCAALAWGCIDESNARSLELLERRGARRLGRLESLLVYRQFPRESLDIGELGDDTGPSIREALDESQRDHALRYGAPVNVPFYAAIDANGIVAGARAAPGRIDLSPSGGAWAAAYSALVRLIPPARRRFDPRSLNYLRLSDIVVRPGAEIQWQHFLPTLLARHRAHMAMFILDPSSRTYRQLQQAGLFGRFAAATRQQLGVLGDTWNISSTQLEILRREAVGIGPLDL